MHYYALVEIPNNVPVDEAVAEAMEPYRERWDEDTADYYNDGFWDWYQIGGRWKRHHSDVAYRGDMTDDDKPFTLILSWGYVSKEHWNGKEFEDLSGKLDDAWNNLDPTTRLVVVDYHY